MISITPNISIPLSEIEFQAIRSQGAGGQNVNKVSSAIRLKFDIQSSSLPLNIKHRLLQLDDSRISKDGIINIKAQEFRDQLKNREAALTRLQKIIQQATKTPKPRVATKPSKAAKRKRMDNKSKQGEKKNLRRKPGLE